MKMKRLRTAKDFLRKGTRYTGIERLKDQKFRMYHDNRRQIIEPNDFKGHDISKKTYLTENIY